MSRMPATGGHSEACCNIPPVEDGDYTPKGTYETIDNRKTYVTGSDDATKGIVTIMDIFGFANQTIQGSDLLSQGSEKRKVFLADWIDGDAAEHSWFPPDTPEKQQKLGDYFGRHSPADVAAKLPAYVKTLQAAYPNITSWAVLGFCWGGKVIEVTTSGDSNPFSVAAVAHPAMVDPSSASNITIPYTMLASQDEPEKDVKAFESGLKVPNHVEIFGDQPHGWMAARADLKNARNKEEYHRGYKHVDEFFAKHQ